MAMIAAEQTVRIALALLLVERFQVAGLIVAYLIALLVRGIAVYFVNSRLCFPLRYYTWPSLGAPLIAGALHYFILRWLTGLIWRDEPDHQHCHFLDRHPVLVPGLHLFLRPVGRVG